MPAKPRSRTRFRARGRSLSNGRRRSSAACRTMGGAWRTVSGLRRWDIDHVLVGPGGVVAVETKWQGRGWALDPPEDRVLGAAQQAESNAREGRESAGSAGPMGVAEKWSHARSDSAFHATYWIAVRPRSVTHPDLLRPLLLGL